MDSNSLAAYGETLEEVTARVLEQWAMMMVDPAEDVTPIFDSTLDFYWSEATFTGVFDGTLIVVSQSPFLDMVLDNVLGDDETGIDSQRMDALKELANVISGNFLTAAFGQETVFDLPLFSTSKVNSNTAQQQLGINTKYLFGDDEPVAVSFKIDAV